MFTYAEKKLIKQLNTIEEFNEFFPNYFVKDLVKARNEVPSFYDFIQKSNLLSEKYQEAIERLEKHLAQIEADKKAKFEAAKPKPENYYSTADFKREYSEYMKKGNVHLWDAEQEQFLINMHLSGFKPHNMRNTFKLKFGIERSQGAFEARLQKLHRSGRIPYLG